MKRNPALKSEPLRKAAKGFTILEDFPLIPQCTNYTCGPAVFNAVLKYYGCHLPTTEATIAHHLGTTRKHGTLPASMTYALQTHNFLPRHALRTRISLKAIRENIDFKQPVVVLWNDWHGHWTAVIGYSKTHILLADPANRRSGMRVHKNANFLKHWHATVAGKTYRKFGLLCRLPPNWVKIGRK